MSGLSKLKWVFDFLIVFTFIYGLVFNILPFSVSKIVLFFLVLFCLVNPYTYRRIINDRLVVYAVLVGVAACVHFLFLKYVYSTPGVAFVHQTFWYFTEGIVGTYLLYFYLRKSYNNIQILYLLFFVFLVQSILVGLTFVNSSLRGLINSVLRIDDVRNLSPYRMKGFANSGGPGLSYLHALGVFIGALLFINEKRVRNRAFLIIGIIAITGAQIFIARTGLFFSLLLFFALLVQQAVARRSFIVLLKRILQGLGLLLVTFTVFLAILPRERLEYFNEKVLSRALELFEAYQATGELQSRSTDALQDMYFLPGDPIQIIFGAGEWDGPVGQRTYSKRRVESDVGYVRAIFAIGLVMAFLFYLIYALYIKQLYKTKLGKTFSLGLLCLAVIFIFGETKEPFLVRSSGIVKTLFMVYFVTRFYENERLRLQKASLSLKKA